MLLFCAADLADVRARRHNPRRFGLDATLSDAHIDEAMVWVDSRKEDNSKKVARLNVHRMIFTPSASELTLTFTDAAAQDGEELILNYVQLKPFYPMEN